MRSAVFRLSLVVVIVVALIVAALPLMTSTLATLKRSASADAVAQTDAGAGVIQPSPPKPQPHLTGWSAPAGQYPAYVHDSGGGPDRRVPIRLELVDEGVDAQGKWFQKLRVTVELYGALSYVSETIYGDLGHIDALYDLARKQNPKIAKPEQIFVGMTFDVAVDPTSTYTIRETTTKPDGTKTRWYYNGVVEKLYPARGSLLREVLTPPGDRTGGFRMSGMDGGLVTVPPGQKLVVYQYVPSEGIRSGLERIYGTPSYTALQDFLHQVDWAHRQKLGPGDRFQFVVDAMRSYDDPQPSHGAWQVDDPAVKANYEQLDRQRGEAGIHLAEVGTTFDRFLVGVYDPALTAKDVARLLYGSEEHSDHLIDLAGLWPKPTTPGASPSEKPPLPEDYNPSLFGHPFAVKVDLADEFFVWQQSRDRPNAQTDSILMNGARVEETYPLARDSHGIQRVITYPSGRRKVQYRPNGLTMTALDSVVFLSQLFRDSPVTVDPTERRLNVKLSVLRERRLARLPALVWEWDPQVPRQFGRQPVEIGWALGQEGQVVEVTLLPEDRSGASETVLHGPRYVRVLLLGAAAGIIVVALIATAVRRSRRGYSHSLLR